MEYTPSIWIYYDTSNILNYLRSLSSVSVGKRRTSSDRRYYAVRKADPRNYGDAVSGRTTYDASDPSSRTEIVTGRIAISEVTVVDGS